MQHCCCSMADDWLDAEVGTPSPVSERGKGDCRKWRVGIPKFYIRRELWCRVWPYKDSVHSGISKKISILFIVYNYANCHSLRAQFLNVPNPCRIWRKDYVLFDFVSDLHRVPDLVWPDNATQLYRCSLYNCVREFSSFSLRHFDNGVYSNHFIKTRTGVW